MPHPDNFSPTLYDASQGRDEDDGVLSVADVSGALPWLSDFADELRAVGGDIQDRMACLNHADAIERIVADLKRRG